MRYLLAFLLALIGTASWLAYPEWMVPPRTAMCAATSIRVGLMSLLTTGPVPTGTLGTTTQKEGNYNPYNGRRGHKNPFKEYYRWEYKSPFDSGFKRRSSFDSFDSPFRHRSATGSGSSRSSCSAFDELLGRCR